MTEFTPLASLIGGMMIGASVLMLMAFNGKIAGMSSITSQSLPPWSGLPDTVWRIAFIAGLFGAPFIFQAINGPVHQTVSGNLPLMVVAGLLVGFGSVMGSGCTSGHGVCGLARLSPRSAVSTGTFMAVAAATVFVTRHIIGG